MQRLILTILAAFVMALVFGPFAIQWLKKMKFGQTIYELGPQTHQKKQGTPTMGGVIFAVPAVIATIAFSYKNSSWDFLAIALVSMIGFGLVGFVDDYIKVKLKRSLGLTPKQKLIPQIVLAIGLAFWGYFHPEIGPSLIVPFFGVEWNLGWFYIPLMVFVLVGVTNAANLLDGMDGLLGGCSLINFVTMALISLLLAVADPANADNYLNIAVLCGAMIGSLLGFLRFNAHPAMVFMGDVGSFIIGGALAGVALTTRLSLLLPLVAFAMLVSALSVILQVGYYKATKWYYKTEKGKRIFRMSPLHYHFELGGMPETRVVAMYYIVTAILCLIALLAFTA